MSVSALRAALSSRAALAATARRGISTSPRLLSDVAAAAAPVAPAIPLPSSRPIGAFRGGLFGFLFGTTLAGAGVYGYLVREYRASNELLTEDIYRLHATVERLTSYIQALEERMDGFDRKKR